GACSMFQQQPTPYPTLPPTVVSPNEIFRATGDGPGVTATFSLAEDMRIRVNWDQSSTERFVLAVFSVDPTDTAQQSGYDRVIFEDSLGPSAWHGDDDYIAGTYAIEVEQADGPWEVWVERLDFGQ
ncbi:MAG: hypothetical protein ACE5FI_19255, partial [Anaerolineales bacterium]